MTSATTLGYVLRLRDQGWRGLLPVLPHDAVPAPWLKPGHRQKVLNGRGKAPGRIGARIRDLMMPMIVRKMVAGNSLSWMYDYRIDWSAPVTSTR